MKPEWQHLGFMLGAAHLTLFHTIETQEESTVHHAFSTTCRASLFSAGRVTFFVLAALLLCVNVCLPAPALAAIYNGGVSNGGITDIPLVDTGSNGANDVPASSDDLVMLHSLDISGTTLRASTPTNSCNWVAMRLLMQS